MKIFATFFLYFLLIFNSAADDRKKEASIRTVTGILE